jgi:hypothetical protein
MKTKKIIKLSESDLTRIVKRVLSEQEKPFVPKSYTTTQWNGFIGQNSSNMVPTRGIVKGVKFESTKDPKIVSAKNVTLYSLTSGNSNWAPNTGKVNINFYCAQGKFFITGESTGYVSETLSKALVSNVCGRVNYQTTTAKGGTTYTQQNDAAFTSDKGQSANGPKKGSVWTWDGKIATTKNKFGTVSFTCTPKKYNFNFSFNNQTFSNTGNVLKDALVKKFCRQEVVNKPTTPEPTTPQIPNKPQSQTTTPKRVKLPNLTSEQICNIVDDKIWSYTKTTDNRWYASKDKINWVELTLPKYKAAVDKLNVTDACKVVINSPVEKPEEIEEPIQKLVPKSIVNPNTPTQLAGMQQQVQQQQVQQPIQDLNRREQRRLRRNQ